MKNSVPVLVSASLAFMAGCDGPLRFGPPLPAGVAESSAARPTKERSSSDGPVSKATSPPATGGPSAAPASQMTVRNETVAAADIWKNHRDELAAQAQTLSPPEFQAYVNERSAQLITDKIGEMLLHQRAALRLSPEIEKNLDQHIDGEIRKIVAERHEGVQRRFEKDLQSKGLTIDDVRAQLRRQFTISGYLEAELRPKVVEPTRAEMLALYEKNLDYWRRPARRSMSLIEIRVGDLLSKEVTEPTREQSAAARAGARSKALAARLEVQNGAEFAEVARRHSNDLHAEEGGKWGWVDPASVRERFLPAVEALQKLNEGQVSDPIETPESFFIVRCDELEPGLEPDFPTVQPELAERLFRERYNRLILELVDELRREARLEPADLEPFHAAVVAAALAQPLARSE